MNRDGYYANKTILESAGSGCSTLAATYNETNLTNSQKFITTPTHTEAKNKVAIIGNLIDETKTSYKQTYSDAQISAMVLGSVDDYKVNGAHGGAHSDATCQAALKSTYPNIAKINSTPPTIVVYNTCTYGSSAASTTTCATLNEKY